MDSPVRKSDDLSAFLDAPPTWFAMIVWMFPLFFSIFCILLSLLIRNSQILGYLFLFSFFSFLVVLLSSSTWFRSRIAYIAPCWLFLVVAGSSTSQGALTSAVSKAFSAVTSQLQALEKIEEHERELDKGSPNSLDKRP